MATGVNKHASEAQVTGAVKLPPEVTRVLQKQKRVQRINNEHFFRCHPELRAMIGGFMSAVLKQKPDDPTLFAERYFTQPDLARQLGYSGWTRPPTPEPEIEQFDNDYGLDDEGGDEFGDERMAGTTELDVVELEKMLIGLFKEADRDGSGALDFGEFKELMATAELGITPKELELLLSEVDEDADGNVTYAEFASLAVEVIQTMRLKQRFEETEAIESEYLREAAQSIIGVVPQQLEQMVLQTASAGGLLSRLQVKTLFRSPQLGLSKQQINQAAESVKYDGDGMVSAATLAPTAYGVVERVVMRALAMQNLGEVGAELTRMCEFYDKEESGYLPAPVLKQVLLQGFPFVTRLQANALVSDKDVPTNGAGLVAWREHLPKMTAILKGMGDPNAIRERAELAARADFQPVELMSGKDHETMNELLTSLFTRADKDGSGELDTDEFVQCMLAADFGFSADDALDLMAMFDSDGDGKISYQEFLSLAYDCLVHLARERKIMNSMMMSIEGEGIY
jgi:Ca2+-binding EF-hand superfamily protein